MIEQFKARKKKQEARGILSILGLDFFKEKKERSTNPKKTPQDMSLLRQQEIDFLKLEAEREPNKAKQALIRIQIRTLEQYRDLMQGFVISNLSEGRKMANDAKRQIKLEFQQKIEERMKNVWGEEYPTFEQILQIKKDLSEFEDEASKIFLKLKEVGGQSFEEAYGVLRDEIGRHESELLSLRSDYPLAYSTVEILSFREDLLKEGHIAQVDTVKRNIQEIKLRMTIGKPIFLHGPTGTGKTSLARFAAKELTGKSPDIVYCNPQTREVNIFGRTGIEVKDGQPVTKFDFGPLAKAARNGNVCIFDEFTSLPKEQMSMIKGIVNAKVGDTISIPGNGQVTITQGFQLIFTANLKSDKNPERQDLPPEVANEFSQNNLEIKYSSPEEAWQIFLARIIHEQGDATFSEYDLKFTIPRLLKAMQIIQDSYSGLLAHDMAQKFGLVDAGKVKGLKKLVINQRDIENILESFKVERKRNRNLGFMEFLDERLRQVLTFGEYREDKELATKILASSGLLSTISDAQLGIPAKTLASIPGYKKVDEKDLLASKDTRVFSIKELVEIDPFNTRKRETTEQVTSALGLQDVAGQRVEVMQGVPSDYKSQMSYLEKVYKSNWSHDPQGKVKNGTSITTDISNINYTSPDRLKTNTGKFGEVEFIEQVGNTPNFETTTPSIVDVNFGTEKTKYEAWKKSQKPEVKTNRRGDVFNYIKENYGQTHYLPGLDYWEFIQEKQKTDPTHTSVTTLKNGQWNYFPGSLFRYLSGYLFVPCLGTGGGVLRPDGDWLGRDWSSDRRVVLLPKP